jgi:putative transposase
LCTNALDRRTQLYTEVRAANPARWSRRIRNWSPVGDVCLNPERDTNDRKIRDAA